MRWWTRSPPVMSRVAWVGGWRRWFARLRGPLAGRLHTEIARVAVLGLLLSSVTALWMSAETFEIVTLTGRRSLAGT